MIDKKEIQKRLNGNIGLFLQEHGYKLTSKEEGMFTKSFEWGEYFILVSFWDYLPSHISVIATVGVRVGVVEDICYKFASNRDKKLTNSNSTVIDSLIDLAGYDGLGIKVVKDGELFEAINQARNMIVEYGFPYLEKHTSLFNLEDNFNKRRNRIKFHPLVVLRALVLAKLINSPDLEEKIDYYRPHIEKTPVEIYKEAFRDLAGYLLRSDFSEFDNLPRPPESTFGLAR